MQGRTLKQLEERVNDLVKYYYQRWQPAGEVYIDYSGGRREALFCQRMIQSPRPIVSPRPQA